MDVYVNESLLIYEYKKVAPLITQPAPSSSKSYQHLFLLFVVNTYHATSTSR